MCIVAFDRLTSCVCADYFCCRGETALKCVSTFLKSVKQLYNMHCALNKRLHEDSVMSPKGIFLYISSILLFHFHYNALLA